MGDELTKRVLAVSERDADALRGPKERDGMGDVAFRSVTKRFGETTVLDGLTLEIEAGEFMVLVGPSGCGKSTALRLIAGLEEPTAGELVVGGRVVNGVAPKDRDVAMVFQTYALYPHMSVRENLAFGLRLRHVPRAERERLVAEAATVLGLEVLLDRRPRELSGGQRQRVALGRAITRKPRVFLFDEPLSNLDARLRVQMRAEIAALQRRLGTTTVYVTHDQVEAMTMGHRIAVLHGGRLQQVGAPLDVYERPANAFVASFIGSPPMNLLRAIPVAGGEKLEGDGFVLPAPGLFSALGRGSRPVLVGVRPEALVRATAETLPSTPRWSAMVDSSELLGSEAFVHTRIGEQRLVARLDPHLVPSAGERIELSAEPSALHLFDAETGARLVG